MGNHPDQVNYVFSGITDAQWLVFMDEVRASCDEELGKGTWRKETDAKAVAGSCPAFSKAGFTARLAREG